MKESENEEELTDEAANINNEWMIALSIFTVEFSYIKILANIQHYRFDAKQLRHYSMIN